MSPAKTPNPGRLSAGEGQTAPAGAMSMRLTARDILGETLRVGEDELKRSTTGLTISGVAAGIGMGLSALGPAMLLAALGATAHAELIATLLYPLGFIVVIIGRAQLFTENTLFPVILVLDRRAHARNTLRLWVAVFVGNVIGALIFAAFAEGSDAFSNGITGSLAKLGHTAAQGSFGHLVWAGIGGGWLIALVAWLVTASRLTLAQVALIWLLCFVVGATHLAHCIAGSAEILCAVIAGKVSVGGYVYWLAAATIGNTLGGVVMVSILNYAQVMGRGGGDVRRTERPLEEVEEEVMHLPPPERWTWLPERLRPAGGRSPRR